MRHDDSHPRTLVACLGNEHRGDDGFGPAVARHLGDRIRAATVIVHRGDALELIEHWRGCNRVILVDAIAMAREPGTIVEFDLSENASPLELGGASTHALGPGGAIEIARTLGLLPARVEVVAVVGSEFGAGMPVSAAVAEQVGVVAEKIRRMV